MTLRILADENIPAVEHYAGQLGTVLRFSGRNLQPSQLAGADVLLVRSVTPVNAALLAGSSVRFVGTATSGIDHIDREYLQQQGIGFSYAPGSNANSVVEYVLAALAGVGDHLERVLGGAAVGIVGYGVIGKALAARLKSLGINYRAYDPWLPREAVEQPGELADILDCAVITLHPELTREQPWPSHYLIDETALAAIAPDSLLINASRGPVVDNRALLQRLSNGPAPDVVLDVWEGEPAISQPLLQHVRFGTPHIAGYSLDGKLLATRMLIEALAHYRGLPWQDPGSAVAEPAPLAVTDSDSPANLLRQLVSQRYSIGADDAALRGAALGVGTQEAAAAFDQLRRNYPERRELLGSRVRLQGLSTASQDLLGGLGCLPQDILL